MKKAKFIAGAALALATSFQAKAANMVLAAENIKCGGVLTLERTQESLVILRVEVAAQNTCKAPLHIEIKSQDISGNLTTTTGYVELNPHAIGSVLPLSINNESMLLRLSDQAQNIVQNSYTRADLNEMAQRQEEMNRRQRNSNIATGAAVGGAVVVGAGAVAAAAAANSER